jgi:hypothetical protein
MPSHNSAGTSQQALFEEYVGSLTLWNIEGSGPGHRDEINDAIGNLLRGEVRGLDLWVQGIHAFTLRQ